MRCLAVAVAALGFLGAGDASAVHGRRAHEIAHELHARAPVAVNQIANADFSNGLQGFETTGSVELIPHVEADSSVAAIKLGTSGLDKRQTLTGTSVSQTVKSLTAGSKYTVSFSYSVLSSLKANNCRIQAYWDNVSFGTTSYFPLTMLALTYNWVPFTGTVTPTATSGTLKLSVSCSSIIGAQVYINNISVVKAATATTTTTSTTAKVSTTSTTTAKVATTSTTTAKVSTTSTTSTSVKSSSTSTSAASSTSSTSAASTTLTTLTTSSSSIASSSSVSTTTSSVSSSGTSSTPSSTPSIAAVSGATVDGTILVIAADSDTAAAGSLGLLGYGIPYENLIVPQAGIALPVLNSSATHGNYGGIIVMDSVAYEYSTGWASAITTDQWTALYNYQLSFGVRMVRINEYPGPNFGTSATSGGGCCGDSVSQNISFTDVSDFPTANLVANAEVSTSGLWHVPATITDTTTTKQVAKFGVATGFTSETVAGVINNFSGREQFVWFIGWAPSWSLTSSYLQHAHIHWMTRGVFLGKRKVHLSCQIDDLQISTTLYYPANLPDFKIEIADLQAHVTWQTNINKRLPAGSDFWLELGHNGNGDLISSTLADNNNVCNPTDAVYYDSPNSTDLEFQKPLGTGIDFWPTPGYETYSWTQKCAQLDSFASWFMVAANRNQFAHVSHTFTHLSLNNATYHDTKREIQFNQAWMKQVGIDQATRYSANGLIPPAITGMHNGDAIQAWMDNGIYHVVGDNTRPVLRNPNNVYWPLISTVAANGYDGLVIVPRWSTAIYFNCNTALCTLNEWIATSAGSGDYFNLLAVSKASSVRNLLSLMSDPYMFHQANMHQTTVDTITIGSQTGKMSLVMSWTETMVQELLRLTNWPIQSLKHDDTAQYFLNRKAVDDCNPKLAYSYSSDGKTITAVTVTTNGNTCSVPVPVTIPSGSVAASGGSVTSDVVGSEPPIQWVTLSGSPVTLTLSSPVTV